MGWYLCYFLHRHLDFRVAEFQALADLAGCGGEVQWKKPFGDVEHSPFWYVWLPSEEMCREVLKRSILTRALIEVWGEGADNAELNASIQAFADERKQPYIAEGTTFKVIIEDFGKTEKGTKEDCWAPVVARIQALTPSVTFKGRARMKDAQNIFWSIESADPGDLAGINYIPRRHYFGRVIAQGDRSPIAKYDLRNRRYLGPTSMDVEMGLIMNNMIQARAGGIVWDPFCGTGSILVGAAHYGAHTMGSDIDIRVIKHGKTDKKSGKPVDVWTNFEDYGLPPPVGLLRFDLHKNPLRRGGTEGMLQGVVGDPPYGVRAGGRKSGGRKRLPDGISVKAVPEEFKYDHIPSTMPYPFSECMDDLMDNAARLLDVGGRLAFFLPAAVDAEDAATAGADAVPSHPMLVLKASSMQLLSTRWGRRLVTFEKVATYDEEVAATAKVALLKAREETGGVEDLLERMRATVYHGENKARQMQRHITNNERREKHGITNSKHANGTGDVDGDGDEHNNNGGEGSSGGGGGSGGAVQVESSCDP
jgi:tRNA (guanine10-N2)-methyltransferase